MSPAGTPSTTRATAPATGATRRLRVTQTRSVIGGSRAQRETVRTLGLRRIGDTVVKEDRPEVRGMVTAVAHLVTVEEVE